MTKTTESSKKIVILGNGKSVDLYREDDYKDAIVIGSNVPPEGLRLDYVCAVDAYAVSHAYRSNMPFHERLQEGWKLVLGPRACGGLRGIKSVPGGKETFFDWLKSEGHFYKKVDVIEEAWKIGQRYFSTGHLAFIFASAEYPDADIHIFGFDSLFTGSSESYTRQLLRDKQDSSVLKRAARGATQKKPDVTVSQWYWLWQKVFESDLNKAGSINIHGYEHDPDLDHIHQSLRVVRHYKDSGDEILHAV